MAPPSLLPGAAMSTIPSDVDALPASSQWQITRKLWALAWPVIGLNVLQVLSLVVDTAMIGRVPNHDAALPGMGYGGQVVMLLMVAMIGLTVGTVAMIARAHGAKDTEEVSSIFQQGLQLTVLLGVAIALVGNLLAGPVLLALGANDATLGAGLDYLRPLLMGTPFYYLNILLAASLRGVGNTRLAFLVALVMNALNVVFNYGLILGHYGLPAFGIAGAAYGTVASQFIAVVLMVFLLRRGAMPGLFPSLRPQRIRGDLARRLVHIGWPAALDMVILNAAFLAIVGMLARVDQLAVGAHTIGIRVQALAFVPGMSISQATAAMTGMALGARNITQTRQVAKASVVLCSAVMTSLAALIVGFAGPLVQVFSVQPGTAMFDYAIQWMRLLGWCMPFVGVYIALAGVFQGSGDTRTSLRINGWSTLAFQIPVGWLLGFPLKLGAYGIWLGLPLAFGLKMVLGLLAYRKGRWATLKV